MNLLIDYIGYAAVKILSFIFCLFPPEISLFFGRVMGLFLYTVNKKRRRIAYLNLKAAFSGQYLPGEINKIVKNTYIHFLQTIIEVLMLPRVDGKYTSRYVTIHGMENLIKAKCAGKGIIFLTGHFGNWELLNAVSGANGYKMTVLAREQKHKKLYDLLNSYRELSGTAIISKGFGVKQLIKILKQNGIIGILADQDAGANGFFVDFFGRKASTAEGVLRFAKNTEATIIPVFLARRKGPYHDAYIEPPITVENKSNLTYYQDFVNVFEKHIRNFPNQWLWLHKRWKSTPTKKIVILNDGKQGHLNQSLAIANSIKKVRDNKGFLPEDTKIEIVNVEYKNRTCRILCSLMCSGINNAFFNKARSVLFKLFLISTSYKKIISVYADFIISCGSANEPVNIFLKYENGAKNIIIMKPSYTNPKKANLLFVPFHDQIKERKNIVQLVGAPSFINSEVINKSADRLRREIPDNSNFKFGVLIGGDSKNFNFTENIANLLTQHLTTVLQNNNASLYLTTSRRTPQKVEEILKNELANLNNTKLFVDAKIDRRPYILPSILGVADAIVVSEDSVSMISESLASKKPIFVFRLCKKKNSKKHQIFIDHLVRNNYVQILDLGNIKPDISYYFRNANNDHKIDDEEKIEKALIKIL